LNFRADYSGGSVFVEMHWDEQKRGVYTVNASGSWETYGEVRMDRSSVLGLFRGIIREENAAKAA